MSRVMHPKIIHLGQNQRFAHFWRKIRAKILLLPFIRYSVTFLLTQCEIWEMLSELILSRLLLIRIIHSPRRCGGKTDRQTLCALFQSVFSSSFPFAFSFPFSFSLVCFIVRAKTTIGCFNCYHLCTAPRARFFRRCCPRGTPLCRQSRFARKTALLRGFLPAPRE